ncbi:MAG: clostripain-related cysteine peptidase [Defluviitaleaceae bacterium]|nr:clostripain-related cysteine peptidase [Defluviitaleaceae bacterium]
MRPRFLIPMLSVLALSFALTILSFSGYPQVRLTRNQNFDEPFEIVRNKNTPIGNTRFSRNIGSVNFNNVEFDPWDVAAASMGLSKGAKKPYTIMIYMNGSDLETEHGAATDDLIEMLESGLNADAANIIIFTGGSKAWQNDVIPEYDCVIWEVANGKIYELARVGLRNMGNAGTLSSFIDFGILNFPADKYGLILWDHGGGSISGYGHDEHFGNDNLTLLDLNYAFKQSAMSHTKLEFLGFDTCLLGSVEMAVIAADYAKYLIASEDLIPGDGWDYDFLSVLNDNPSISGAELGKVITDYFMDFYGPHFFDELNMSVIDLEYANHVMCAMGVLMERANRSLGEYPPEAFRNLAVRRSNTKTFGIGSPRDNESDMVDIGHMAFRLSDLYPVEAGDVLSALDRAVIYNRNNSSIYLGGMSTFYIYGGKRNAGNSLNTYTSLNMDGGYTRFLHDFSRALIGNIGRSRTTRSLQEANEGAMPACEDIIQKDLTIWQPLKDEKGSFIMVGIKEEVDNHDNFNLWPFIDGWHICMYKVADSERGKLYAIPSEVNGIDCDLIVLINDEYPEGKILGTRNDNGLITQKGYTDIEIGDEIGFYYQTLDENKWYKGDIFTIERELKLNWAKAPKDGIYTSIRSICIWNNVHFSPLVRA